MKRVLVEFRLRDIDICQVHELEWNYQADCLDVWQIHNSSRTLKARIPSASLTEATKNITRDCAANEIVVKVAPEIKERLFRGELELRGDHKLFYDQFTRQVWITQLPKDAMS